MSMKVETSFVEVAKSGDIAYSRGTYEMTATDPQTKQPILIKGTYVTTFRKAADGSWGPWRISIRLLALRYQPRTISAPLFAIIYAKAHAFDRVRAAFLVRLRRLPGPIVVPGENEMGVRILLGRCLELLDRLSIVRALLQQQHP